jgi:hypothetical protein
MKTLLLLALALPAFAAHLISIGWTDSINPSGTKYNVYRLTGSCPTVPPQVSPPGGAWTPIASGVIATNATDGAVTPGTTYCYLVTAVVTGSESAPSNTTQAIEPIAFPPTMVQVTLIQ